MSDNFNSDYDILLARAKGRLLAAQKAYETALREKEEVEACVALGPCHYREMNILEAEIRKAIYPEGSVAPYGDGQLRMITTRRAFFRLSQMKALSSSHSLFAACILLAAIC